MDEKLDETLNYQTNQYKKCNDSDNESNLLKKNQNISLINKKNVKGNIRKIIIFQCYISAILLATLGSFKIINPSTYNELKNEIKESMVGPDLKTGFKNVFYKTQNWLENSKPIEIFKSEDKDEKKSEQILNKNTDLQDYDKDKYLNEPIQEKKNIEIENKPKNTDENKKDEITIHKPKQPIDGHLEISSKYGPRIDPLTGKPGDFHYGVDIKVNDGTPILAIANGTIIAAGYSTNNGNYLKMQHEDGYESVYVHCSKLLVEKGAQVIGGQVVALSGHSGKNVTGPHLHFGMKKDGKWIDPNTIFPTFT